jgi:ubiquinone/menaquinone biosynthesis C-methylase UbiE
MILYNSIGKGYNRTRQADPRIVSKIISLLDLTPGKTIADIGAGTGNYSNAIAELGYQIIAIEPATMMQSQAQPHSNVKWLTAKAEQIPLANSVVDAAVIMLALHHFNGVAESWYEFCFAQSGQTP